ncbi:MAG: response regulator transcription factor [Gemmatimonadota bacterium]
MPISGATYKEAHSSRPEALELDEQLWDHIRTARSFVDRQSGSLDGAKSASAVVIRQPGGESVVIVLVDRGPEKMTNGEDLCRRFNLTAREAEVAVLLAERLSCREIAERLGLSFHTARTHTDRILMKLGVRSKNEVRQRVRQ